MCGILGLFNIKTKKKHILTSRANKLMLKILHRGPDA